MGIISWFKRNRAIALYDDGTLLLQQGDFAAAADLLQKAINLRPDFAEAYHNLGNALLGVNLGNTLLGVVANEDALLAFDNAVALRPQFPEAHNNRGRALAALGRHEEALTAFDAALNLEPGYLKARENRRWCEQWIGGGGPRVFLPREIPWLWQRVRDGQLTEEQALRVVATFIRQEERLQQVHAEQVEDVQQRGDRAHAENLEQAHKLFEPLDHQTKLDNLGAEAQDIPVDLVLTGADLVI